MSAEHKNQPVRLASKCIFTALANSAPIGEFLSAFQRATGLSLKLIPPASFSDCQAVESDENAFCSLVRRHESGGRAYCEVQAELLKGVDKPTAKRHLKCFAEMTHLAVPITVDGQHVATLLAGQVFLRQLTKRDFTPVRKHLIRYGLQCQLPRLEQLWLASPAISPDRLEGCAGVLSALARMIGECASRWMLANASDEPLAVKKAKAFIAGHQAERIALQDLARHVHLSPKHVSRLFKNTTGMTVTEYIWRAKIERAKELLHDPELIIKEVACASGLQSLSHFNHVFRKLVGVSPTAYRADIGQRKADRTEVK